MQETRCILVLNYKYSLRKLFPFFCEVLEIKIKKTYKTLNKDVVNDNW